MKIKVEYDEQLLKTIEAIRMDEIKDLEERLEKVTNALKDSVDIILQQKADLEIAKEIVERYQNYFENKGKNDHLYN
jgi:predicted class III extradiol MEMO1 family dioxygenase